MSRLSKTLAAFLVALAAWDPGASAARADEPEATVAGALAAGDVESGREVAAQCAACHGPEGLSSTPGAPHLAGQHATYILAALRSYRDGVRTGPDMAIMAEIVPALSESDMVNLAVYYGSLPAFADAVSATSAAAEAARRAVAWNPLAAGQAAAEACAGCHGDNGNSDIPETPGLAGQPREYLLAAIQSYKDGTRKHEEMQAFTEDLGEAELEQLARYYASLKPRRSEVSGAGDPFAGRAAITDCVNCHHEDGRAGDQATPKLAGLDADYLAVALQAYKDGTRTHAAMQSSVSALDQTDIQNIAAFYAAKEPNAKGLPKPLGVKDWARRCERCHGTAGHSTDIRFPILAGQSKEYLVKALKLYHGGLRSNSMMYAMSFPMGKPDIENLAAYYAGQTSK
jgi:cytochrome c553